MESTSGGGLRKRQKIAKSNQYMFLWIIGASAVVGFSVVMMVFLLQRIWFGEQVIAEKEKTVSVLNQNLQAVPALKDNVRLLNTNEALKSSRLDAKSSALQVVLDALPADANSTALASSLQTKLLSGVPGVTIESIKVDPVSGIEVDATETTASTSSSQFSNQISFSFTVSASVSDQNGLKKILKQIESSIRPFSIGLVTIESQGTRLLMSASGYGYYEPGQKVELQDKVIKP